MRGTARLDGPVPTYLMQRHEVYVPSNGPKGAKGGEKRGCERRETFFFFFFGRSASRGPPLLFSSEMSP